MVLAPRQGAAYFQQWEGKGPTADEVSVVKRNLVLAIVLVAACSCCDRHPQGPNSPPVIDAFRPPEQVLEVLVGDTVDFSITAYDPDGDPLSYSYLIDGRQVASSRRWRYVTFEAGSCSVVGVVSDGSDSSRVSWSLTRVDVLNLPPEIVYSEPPDSTPGVIVGESLRFFLRAQDPEGDPVSYWYEVGGNVVSRRQEFIFSGERIGAFMVKGFASDGNIASRQVWEVFVSALPDSIAPASVNLVGVEKGGEVGQITATWIAVGDDGMIGMPSRYLIRTSPFPILTESDWATGGMRPEQPQPVQPGDTMRVTLGGLLPAHTVYVAVKAIDEFGNLSPLGNTLGSRVKGMEVYGSVADALTGSWVEGIRVSLLDNADTTDSQGRFALTELGQGQATFAVRDELGGSLGEYFDLAMNYRVEHMDTLGLWIVPNALLETTYYPEFLTYFRSITDMIDNPFGNTLRRWRFPVDLYVPPYVGGGVDYQQAVTQAASDWEDMTGLDLFRLVPSEPEVGVAVRYESSRLLREFYEVTEWTTGMYPVKGLVHLRIAYNDSTEWYLLVVIRHELGHAIGLSHSRDPNHLMVGARSPAVQYPSPDEVRAVRVLYHIPRGTNMNNYRVD